MPARVTLPNSAVGKFKKLYYEEKLSVRLVAEKMGCSMDSAYSFMKRHGLKRRTFKEGRALRFEQEPLSYRFKISLSQKEEKLKIAGILLYWAEGYKASDNSNIDFANSDSAMVVVFVRFLREICGITESKLRVQLYCFSNQDIAKIIKYWSGLLSIPSSQFIKPYVRDDYRLDKVGKMPYGLVHIRYSDKKLRRYIKELIEECKRMFA